MSGKTAIVIGATGMVGKQVLNYLLDFAVYTQVIAVTRKALPTHPKLKNLVIDFDRLTEALKKVKADDAFCCLGTTIKQSNNKRERKKFTPLSHDEILNVFEKIIKDDTRPEDPLNETKAFKNYYAARNWFNSSRVKITADNLEANAANWLRKGDAMKKLNEKIQPAAQTAAASFMNAKPY